MSWRGHTTTNEQDRLVRKLESLGLLDAVELINDLDTDLASTHTQLEGLREQTKSLSKVARRMLCYLPRAYDSEGPRGELEAAIKEAEA